MGLLLRCHVGWSFALRCCSARLACRFPYWKLPDKGHVCELVTDSVVDDRVLGSDGVCRVSFPGSAGSTGVFCEGGVLGRFERIRLNRKTPANLGVLGCPVSVFVWHWGSICGAHVLHECHHSDDGSSLGHRVGVGRILGLHWPTSPGLDIHMHKALTTRLLTCPLRPTPGVWGCQCSKLRHPQLQC